MGDPSDSEGSLGGAGGGLGVTRVCEGSEGRDDGNGGGGELLMLMNQPPPPPPPEMTPILQGSVGQGDPPTVPL